MNKYVYEQEFKYYKQLSYSITTLRYVHVLYFYRVFNICTQMFVCNSLNL